MKKAFTYGIFFLICIVTIGFLISRTRIDKTESVKRSDSNSENEYTDKAPGMIEENTLNSDEKENSENIEKSISPWSAPDSYTYVLNDMFRFDADVIVSDKFTNGIFYKTKGYYQEYDTDAFYEMFFSDAEIKDEDTYNIMGRGGKMSQGISYTSADGSVLYVEPIDLIYVRQTERNDYFYVFTNLRINYDMYNPYKYSLTEQLSFATREEAVQHLMDTLGKIGSHADSITYKAYALDVSTLCEEAKRFDDWATYQDDNALKKDWTVEEEAYAISLWQENQGLPVWTANINSYGVIDESMAPVHAIYREDGFVWFDFTGFLDFETSEEYDVLLSFEDIINKISDKYTDIISSDKILVTEMMLCILTSSDGQGGYNLYPAWVCTYEYEGGNSVGQMVFDAVTGYEI